ncbi:hypothetical protein ACQCVE_10410 [Metabacillus sp. 113a]|uniref:hypothetical protein n=1 Tax=Metabacillus sp. 113a TaxID=3404706 RepID=UPI003CEFBA3F
MPNFFWYLLLFIFTGLMLYSAGIKDKKRAIVLWLFNSGLSYLFELVVYVMYNCYLYKPDVFKDPFVDSTFGSIFSQGLSVPAAATVAALFKSGAASILIFSYIFSAIEVLFLHLDIYEHVWWKTSYTFFFIPVLFSISKLWYWLLKKGRIQTLFITHYVCMITLSTTITWLLFAIRPTVLFHFGLFEEPSRDHTFANAIYFIAVSLFYSIFAFTKWKTLKLLLFILLLAADYLLVQHHVILIHHAMDGAGLVLTHLFFLGASLLLEKQLHRHEE